MSKPSMLLPPVRNKSIKFNIFALDLIIGSMLAFEDVNGVERAIYYLSRLLIDENTRYNLIENLLMSLYFHV